MTKHYCHTILIIALLVVGCQTKKTSADTVLLNGNIITIATEGQRAEAIAIKAGKIIAVGKNAEIQKYVGNETKSIDLKGKTVVPGFNDAHIHPIPVFPFESPHNVVDLGPDHVKNMDELVALLKKKADVTPKGIPVKGIGYQDTKLGAHPTRDILDKISEEHPVIIRHSSGHITAVNSYVLKKANITARTKDTAGGSFDRDKSGEPNGVCREAAAQQVLQAAKLKLPDAPSEREEMEAYQKCFENYLHDGITSITEAGSSFHKMNLYKKLQESGMSLRINLLMSESILDSVITKGIKQGYGDEHLRISGIKVFHGNSLSGRTCWLNEPYDMINPATGKKDYYGIPPKRNQEQLDSLFQKIHQHGLQIACHSNGDREIEMVLTAIENVQLGEPAHLRRHRIEHCSVTNDSILKRVKNDSVVIVLHSYIYEHGDKMLVYGAKRWPMMHPNHSAIEKGIHVAQHSDAPISAPIPMRRIQSLATRTSAEGIVIGENQRITAEEAIRLWTYGGAYASFEEEIKGTLSVGQLADLVVLSEDPTKTDIFKLKDIKVLKTFIDGKIVYEANN